MLGHLKYDEKKNLKMDISVKSKDIASKQISGCAMKTTNKKSNNGKQFSMDKSIDHWDIQTTIFSCRTGNLEL